LTFRGVEGDYYHTNFEVTVDTLEDVSRIATAARIAAMILTPRTTGGEQHHGYARQARQGDGHRTDHAAVDTRTERAHRAADTATDANDAA
jgi:hypothetical protein